MAERWQRAEKRDEENRGRKLVRERGQGRACQRTPATEGEYKSKRENERQRESHPGMHEKVRGRRRREWQAEGRG